MALSIDPEDARDMELQREIEAAAEVFLNAHGLERSTAKDQYLSLLKAFTGKVIAASRFFRNTAFITQPSAFS